MFKQEYPLTLVMIVTGDVDRSEFEPDAIWQLVSESTYRVTQKVRRSGNQLVGRTDTFAESFIEVMDDRFVSLIAD